MKKEKERAAKPNYTIDTVKRLKQGFKKRIGCFLLMGIDAFADIAKWHSRRTGFRECEFVVASRPGFSLADDRQCPAGRLRPRMGSHPAFQTQAATGFSAKRRDHASAE